MIDPIFNMFKIKFDILDSWSALKNVKKVRIFINVENVFKVLYSQRLNNYLLANGNTVDVKRCLVSNIINLAQHYRLYCAKCRVDNEIFLYWNTSSKKYLNKEYISDYRSYYNNKIYKNDNCYYLSQCMDDVYDQLKVIISYVNQVYMITDDEIESGLIPYIFYRDQKDDSMKNIIVTNSKYEYQYVLYGFDVWKPDREDSLRLTSDNVVDHLKELNKIVSIDTVPINYVPFIISLLGDKYRNIPKINGVGLASIIKMINRGLKTFIITENTTNIDMLSQCIDDKYRDIFMNNYKCTSLPHQYEKMSGAIERRIFDCVVDKYDDTALHYLNDKYFKEHLIMTIDTRREQLQRQLIE